jgi:hypothetical protein
MPRKPGSNPSTKQPSPSQVAREKEAAARRAARAVEDAKQEAALVLNIQLRAALRAAEAVEKAAVDGREQAAAALRAVEEAELQRRCAAIAVFKTDAARRKGEKDIRRIERDARNQAQQDWALSAHGLSIRMRGPGVGL